MGEVDGGQLELLQRDVAPHVELGEVAHREDPDLLPAPDPPVVQRPRLGALGVGLPLAELVTEGEHALLGPGALLVTAPASERGVEAVGLQRIEQGPGLQLVARRGRAVLLDTTAIDRLLHRGDDELVAGVTDAPVAELDDLGKVVAGVDVQDRKRERQRPAQADRLLGEAQQDDRVLTAAEQQHGALQLGHDLPDHMDRLRLQDAKLVHPRRGHRDRPPCCTRTNISDLVDFVHGARPGSPPRGVCQHGNPLAPVR
jgi:hypothetical protein